MVKKRADDLIASVLVIPQTSGHNVNSNTTSDEVALHNTQLSSFVADKEEVGFWCASLPHHTDGELDAKSDNRGLLAISNLKSHFFSGDRKEVEEIDLYGAGSPRRTNIQPQSDGDSRRTSAMSEDKEEPKMEEVDLLNGAISLLSAGFGVELEPNSHGASTTSSTSSSELAMQVTPSTSLADEMEGDLIDLSDDSPLLRADGDFKSSRSNNRTPKSSISKDNSSKYTKALTVSHQIRHPSVVVSKSTSGIPKHEVFLHNLPSKNAPVSEVRTWIASWFIGRDITFEVPWEGTDIGMQDYIDCISWSGHDLHSSWSNSLELDLRGWMLGGYARPIVRDIERARDMERERKWAALWRRFADFLWGVVFMAILGLVLAIVVPCPCGRY